MKNKKLIIISLGVIVLGCVIFGVWKWSSMRKAKQPQAVAVQYKDPKVENVEAYAQWPTYDNKKYNYQLKYPTDWHVFSDEAEADFTDQSLGGTAVKQGGSIFFSNKDSLDYTQETKPDDFHLLGLMLYEKQDSGIDDFSKLLGFTEATGVSNIVFKADNLVGKEYVSVGATDSEPRVAIIFKNNDRFYVFHLEFSGSDPEVLKNMEKIVGSFHNVE